MKTDKQVNDFIAYLKGYFNNGFKANPALEAAVLNYTKQIQLDAAKWGVEQAAKAYVGFEMPTGYTGKNQVNGIHFNSGHAHGVANMREKARDLANNLTLDQLPI